MASGNSQTPNMVYFILQPAPKEIYCRLCLSNSLTSKYKQVFSTFNDLRTVAETIRDIAKIEISESDNYSKLICLNCFERLTAVEDFKALITKSDLMLRQRSEEPQDPLSTTSLASNLIIENKQDSVDDIVIKEEFPLDIVNNEICDGNNKNAESKVENASQEQLPSREILCPKCYLSFKNYESRREHYRTSCGFVLKHKCSFCNKGFAKTRECRVHEASHQDITPYQCEKCGKSFKYKASLDSHKFTHLESKYECNICNKLLRNPNSLAYHKVLHQEQSPYICEICHRRYKSETHLKAHKKQAHNRSLVVCDICGKLVRSLTNHRKIHTKPFKCTICYKFFDLKNDLTNHLMTHSDEKLQSCEICQKEFRHPSSLARHILIHKNTNQFSCHVCSKQFSVKKRLIRHLKNVHKIENTK